MIETPAQGAPLSDTIRADFKAFMGLDAGQERSLLRRRLDVLTLPGFWAVTLYRVASRLHSRGLAPIARLVMTLGVVLFSCEFSPRMQAGPGLVIPHPQGVTMGAGVVLGSRVKLLRAVGMGTAGYRRQDQATVGPSSATTASCVTVRRFSVRYASVIAARSERAWCCSNRCPTIRSLRSARNSTSARVTIDDIRNFDMS